MGFFKSWFQPPVYKVPPPQDPLDRRWADSPIVNQGNGIQCSSIAVVGAMNQWLNLKAGKNTHNLPWEPLWQTQGNHSNLSAALTYAGMTGVEGYKVTQSLIFEQATVGALYDWIQAQLNLKYSVVFEMRQSGELNSNHKLALETQDIYRSWHAMCVSGTTSNFIICKNSFGVECGENGYKYVSPALMVASGVKLYAITDVRKNA